MAAASRLLLLCVLAGTAMAAIPHVRPPPYERKFNSSVINSLIDDISGRMKDPDLATLFSNCLPNTLDTTVLHFNASAPDSFLITGDISAQWLRDSTNQLLPYLPYVSKDENLRLLVCGLVRRQSRDVAYDPYANSFNFANEGGPHQDDFRKPKMTPHVFEGKYELDSLAAFLKISYGYFNWTNDTSCFDDAWKKGAQVAVDTIRRQQAGSEEDLSNPAYLFQRLTTVASDTTILSGAGPPAHRCGLSKCVFRPSDDATTLPFLVPANAMASVELTHLAELLEALDDPSVKPLAEQARKLGAEIYDAVYGFAVRDGQFVYEVDGFGSSYMMDDANIPSLLSLPFLGFVDKDDPKYIATRQTVLSTRNPYYFNGSAGAGIGGPHEGLGYIWPMALMVQALTSNSDAEILQCLEWLKGASANTGFMHESYWKDDVTKFTRSWFAWANGLFGTLILTLARERPHLIF